jgi:hypothetical protein
MSLFRLPRGKLAFAQRSNESPSGAFKRQRGLRQQMEGPCPDKFGFVQSCWTKKPTISR